ncbi:extracellular solute-binding protein [Lachnospiraceae bacterium ASD3451]|uniref:extracellular solute-binding protein n=1 Tax=Diplocloster agilis TaxID=2850323 RepID=UPI001DD2395F|nr:extracellular solute-binding protein [Diplocloster agilis]MBU9747098.1 extracellular solute-binding protein [Diplocloster agilis]
MKKQICILLVICMTVLGISACGKSDDGAVADTNTNSTTGAEQGSASEQSGDKKKITFAYLDASGEDAKEDGWIHKWAMDTYDKWDQKDQVELELIPYVGSEGDYFTKMALELSDKSTAPDIFYEDSFQVTADAAANYLAPLDEYLGSWESWSNGSVIDACKEAATGMDGKVYGIPLATDSRGIWANTAVLQQAGLSKDWKPATWAELLDGCRQIKEKCEGVVPFWYTCEETSEATSINTFEMVLYGTKDHLFDTETGKWNIRSKDMLSSLEFFQTTMKEELTGSASEVTNTNSLNYAMEYLRDGKLGMVLTSTAVPNAFYSAGQSFEWADWEKTLSLIPMPTQNGDLGGSVTMSGGYAWSVSSHSEEKELAFDFITAMMDNKEQVVTYMMECGQLPTIDVSDAANYGDLSSRPFMQEATELLQNAQYRPHNEKYSEVSTFLSQMVNSVVCGNDPAEALENYSQSVISIVGEENTQDLSK